LLPAVPAISAVAAISAASTASTATAAVTAAPAAVSAAPATTAAALSLRPCFVHHEVTPAEILTVQGIDGPIRVFIVGNFDEGEAARLSSKTITD
jgi:hypothetical protein